MHRDEPFVVIRPGRGPYLVAARGTRDGYRLVVRATDGNTFSISRRGDNIVQRWRGSMGPTCRSDGSRAW
jgi:hypothetical protein